MEDYYECLHHKKEVGSACSQKSHPALPFSATFFADRTSYISQIARAIALQQAYRRAEFTHPRQNAPKVGQIRNLGLLDKEEDSRAVLALNKSP